MTVTIVYATIAEISTTNYDNCYNDNEEHNHSTKRHLTSSMNMVIAINISQAQDIPALIART